MSLPAVPNVISQDMPSATVELRDDDDVCDVLQGDACRGGNVFHGGGQLRIARAAALTQGIACPTAIIRHSGGVSVWPLRVIQHLGVNVATDLMAPVAQYSEIIGAPLPADALAALCKALHAAYGVDALLARRVRADGGLAPAFAATARIEGDAAPYIDLAALGSFDRYALRFGKQTRRNRQQRRRRLEQAHGALGFTVLRGCEGRAEVAKALQWKRQWLEAQGHASPVLDRGSNETFLRNLCDDPSICISVLRAGQQAIAVEIGFTAGAHYAAYLGAFDPCVSRFSAGQEQMLRTVAWCFDNGFERYDLLAPANPYKFGWADDSVAVHDYCVGLSARGSGYAMLRKLAQSPVQRRLRDLPPSVRRSARRYGLPAAGLGASAVALTMLAD